MYTQLWALLKGERRKGADSGGPLTGQPSPLERLPAMDLSPLTELLSTCT